jgi:uncharacterized protein (DUF2384 family)
VTDERRRHDRPARSDTRPGTPGTQRFRPRQSGPRLAPDAAERQGRIARVAWISFGGRDGAVAFLNDHHDALGGRPIDLAIASEAGCDAVMRVIAARAADG